MAVDIRLLGHEDKSAFERVAPGVYDNPLDPRAIREFLGDPRHHVVVAIDEGCIVGSITAVHYVHPDKPSPELWINELGVAPSHRGLGIAKTQLRAMLSTARDLGCREAWVLTDQANLSAIRAYAAVGGIEAPLDQVMFSFGLAGDGEPDRS